MALELTEEMKKQLGEICTDIVKKNDSAEKKKRKLIFNKKDIAFEAFLKNYVELGSIINNATVEDVNDILSQFGTSSAKAEEIKELEEKRAELKKQAGEISKKINTLKISAKSNKTISVK